MSNARGSSDEESELCRIKLQLDQAKDKIENMEAFYNKLFAKFTETSLSHNADKKLLETRIAEKTTLATKLKKLEHQLLERNMELHRVTQELTLERRKTNQLLLKLSEGGQKIEMSFGDETTGSESSAITEPDDSLEVARRRYGNQRPPETLSIRTPQVRRQKAEVNDAAEISPIPLPPLEVSTINIPSPINSSTPNAETTPSICIFDDSAVDATPVADAKRSKNNTKKLSSVLIIKKHYRPQATVSFAQSATRTKPTNYEPKRPRLVKDASMEERDMEDMDEESQTLLSTTVVQEGTIWTAPSINDPDFVLVRIVPQPSKTGKVNTKAKPKHFVAKVVGHRISHGGEGATLFQVQYYCKKAGRTGIYFVLSTVNENKFEVDEAQIIISLPSPIEGRRGLITFPEFLFEAYLMG